MSIHDGPNIGILGERITDILVAATAHGVAFLVFF